MAKSSKKSKKSKKEKKEVLKEGEWEFTFPNEDKYVGHYCAHINGLAWRQGTGVYKTHDGHIYESEWKDDKLNETQNVKITFPNKEEYYGRIQKYKYQGPGTYVFSNSGRLTCNFANNKPVGEVIYIDKFDDIWYGKAEAESVVLAREHIFSYELNNERGRGKLKREIKVDDEIEITESDQSTEQDSFEMKEQERVIFAKSFQTPADIDFNESEWVKKYETYEETKKKCLDKLATHTFDSLTEEEKNWYQQYRQDIKKVQKRTEKNLKNVHADLLKRHFKEEIKNTCPPISVFHGRPYKVLEGEGDGEGDPFESYRMLSI